MKVKKQKDKKRHYLPAATIGYFSADTSPERLRKRLVWVLRKKTDTPRLDEAENVGFGKLIYGYGKDDLFDGDNYFKAAEPWIHQPVDRIMASPDSWVPADDWAWEFVQSPNRDFILGDRGITGTYVTRWETNGYFVPLRKNFGVMLGPAPYPKTLQWSDGTWRIDIPAYTAPADFTDQINHVTWHAARQEVYGPNREQLLEVKALADSVPPSIQAIAPQYEAAQLLGLDLQKRMKDEMLWLKLLFGMNGPEDKSEIMYLTV